MFSVQKAWCSPWQRRVIFWRRLVWPAVAEIKYTFKNIILCLFLYFSLFRGLSALSFRSFPILPLCLTRSTAWALSAIHCVSSFFMLNPTQTSTPDPHWSADVCQLRILSDALIWPPPPWLPPSYPWARMLYISHNFIIARSAARSRRLLPFHLSAWLTLFWVFL